MRGWVRVHSYTRPLENLLNYQPWELRSPEHRAMHELESGRRLAQGLIAKLSGIKDRDQAGTLRGREIWIDAAQFPALPEGEYYHHQLLGLSAFDQNGRPLGEVRKILETAAHDVLLIRDAQEYLIPYAPGETVLGVDLAQGRIDLRWDGIRE